MEGQAIVGDEAYSSEGALLQERAARRWPLDNRRRPTQPSCVRPPSAVAVLRIQLGTAATSNLWLYYVPSQAVAGIKMAVLGVGALL